MSDNKPQPADEDPQEDKPNRLVAGSLNRWDSLMDRLINEARAAGKFDDLRNEGRPLVVDENPHAGDKALAYKLLKDNDFTLPWIATRRDLLTDLARWRGKLRRFGHKFSVEWRTATTPEAQGMQRHRWRRMVADWEAELALLNRRIQVLNLQLPSQSLALVPLDMDEELRRIGARRDP